MHASMLISNCRCELLCPVRLNDVFIHSLPRKMQGAVMHFVPLNRFLSDTQRDRKIMRQLEWAPYLGGWDPGMAEMLQMESYCEGV